MTKNSQTLYFMIRSLIIYYFLSSPTILYHSPPDWVFHCRRLFDWLTRAVLELSGGGVVSTPPSSCLLTLILKWKLALNFNPWVKFQTFRHLTPSSFRSIPTLGKSDSWLYDGAVYHGSWWMWLTDEGLCGGRRGTPLQGRGGDEGPVSQVS